MTKSNNDKAQLVKNLKEELIQVLLQLDKVGTVVFEDIDCDHGVYNFSDVVYSESNNTCTIQISMWSDNLPRQQQDSNKEKKRMISASEAKAETSKITKTIKEKQLEEIENMIKNAISKGESHVFWDGFLNPEVVTELRSLGYDVEYSRQYNECSHTISWK